MEVQPLSKHLRSRRRLMWRTLSAAVYPKAAAWHIMQKLITGQAARGNKSQIASNHRLPCPTSHPYGTWATCPLVQTSHHDASSPLIRILMFQHLGVFSNSLETNFFGGPDLPESNCGLRSIWAWPKSNRTPFLQGPT